MSVPSSYDAVTITVSPGQMFDTNINGAVIANEIISDLNDIMTALTSLQLSWFGGSATEMQAFADQWQGAVTALFGTGEDNPGDEVGAINQLLMGVQLAEQNYDNADVFVSGMFSQLSTALLAPGPATPPAPSSIINDNPQTPSTFINEVFP
jgi:hypothetical protein